MTTAGRTAEGTPHRRRARNGAQRSARPRVLVTHAEILRLLPEETRTRLEREADVRLVPTADTLRRGAAKADAIVTLLTRRIDRALLEAAKNLKVVGNVAVGVDNIDLAACADQGVRVVNTPGVLTRATAELALTLLLAAARRVPEGERMCREGRFETWELGLLLGKELKGRNAVIVGAGRIGKETGRLFRAIGLRVEFITRRATERAIREKLRRAQVLSIHLPLSASTRHWLNAGRIGLLPRDSIVINTARGPVIDERALIEALRTRRIFSAGLDVYEFEPKIPAALRRLPNTVLLPHVGSATEATRRKMVQTAVEGTLEVLAGRMPRNLVRSAVRGA